MVCAQRNAAFFFVAALFLCLAAAALQSAAAADRSLLNADMMMKGEGMKKTMGGEGDMGKETTMMGGEKSSSMTTMKMKKKKMMKPMCPTSMPMYKKPSEMSGKPFNMVTKKDLFASVSTKPNGANENMSSALKSANLAQIIFTLKAQTQFAPHYHPGASELWTVTEGKLTAFNLVNDELFVFRDLLPGQSVLFPKNTLHGFFNSAKENKGVASAVFNSNMPGAMFYEDLTCTPMLAMGNPTLAEVQKLIKHTEAYDKPDKIKGSPFFMLM